MQNDSKRKGKRAFDLLPVCWNGVSTTSSKKAMERQNFASPRKEMHKTGAYVAAGVLNLFANFPSSLAKGTRGKKYRELQWSEALIQTLLTPRTRVKVQRSFSSRY